MTFPDPIADIKIQITGIKDPLIAEGTTYDELVDIVHEVRAGALRQQAQIRRLEKEINSLKCR